MRRPIRTAAFALVARATTSGQAQPPRSGVPNLPAPVRLAKASGHGSNSRADKLRPDTLPNPLVLASGERVTDADRWYKARSPEINCPRSGTVSLAGKGPGPGSTTGTLNKPNLHNIGAIIRRCVVKYHAITHSTRSCSVKMPWATGLPEVDPVEPDVGHRARVLDWESSSRSGRGRSCRSSGKGKHCGWPGGPNLPRLRRESRMSPWPTRRELRMSPWPTFLTSASYDPASYPPGEN